MLLASAFLSNPTSQFNGIIDAPIELLPKGADDLEDTTKVASEQQLEHREIRD